MLQPSTLAFLHDLSHHNDREWFAAHRERYVAAKQDAEAFFDAVREGLIPTMPRLEEVRARTLMYRLMVRWSKGRLPYKTHFAAYFHPAGRKTPLPGYFLRIESGASALAAGLWSPSAAHLAAVHGEIDYALPEWLGLVEDPGFKKVFTLEDDHRAAVPKVYAAGHPAAVWLTRKSFVAMHPLPDELLESEDAVVYGVNALRKAAPFVAFLKRALDGDVR